jgi:hypothetical protein
VIAIAPAIPWTLWLIDKSIFGGVHRIIRIPENDAARIKTVNRTGRVGIFAIAHGDMTALIRIGIRDELPCISGKIEDCATIGSPALLMKVNLQP